jgi:hypothetical protein
MRFTPVRSTVVREGGHRSAPTVDRTPASTMPEVSIAGNSAEEYKSVCEFMRLYATLRFYRLALLLGTTGSLVTALTSTVVRAQFHRVEILKLGGLVISLAFLVMELRATSQWVLLRDRCNQLAQALRFQGVPTSSRWDPLTTSGAGFYLYASVAVLWLLSLLLGLDKSM